MVQNGESLNDGSDERMLSVEEKERLAKKDEVKFISGDQQNGDAKIDIGNLEKQFTGMTKEELMKYANDPFWVRLRWIFFILFWVLWVAMLVGAILIIINAPKCAAPTPLVWWKQGPLVNMKSSEISNNDLNQATKIHAKGVIYQLPPEDTYLVQTPEIEKKITKIIDYYNDKNIKVILDLTPNYVNENSPMFRDALKNETNQSAFIWLQSPEIPNNWLSIINGSAWDEVIPKNYVLSQFGDKKYDLHMNSSIVQKEFRNVLQHLIKLGVRGFRLTNAKHFIINKNLKDEVISDDANYIHTQYGFWTHTQTTFQNGLRSLFYEYKLFIKNSTDEPVFLSVTDDIIRPEVFQIKSTEYGLDIPIYGRLPEILAEQSKTFHKNLYNELRKTFDTTGNTTTPWLQWNYKYENFGELSPSAYNIFFMLLPGVPVQTVNTILLNNVSTELIEELEAHRLSSSYMHGTFELYNSGDIVAYSRIKSGNPGFFVALNPTDTYVLGNFTSTGLPDKMTFDLLSDNYNGTGVSKGKVSSDAIPLSPYSAVVLTYVPVK